VQFIHNIPIANKLEVSSDWSKGDIYNDNQTSNPWIQPTKPVSYIFRKIMSREVVAEKLALETTFRA
jgi:hypothetical protein